MNKFSFYTIDGALKEYTDNLIFDIRENAYSRDINIEIPVLILDMVSKDQPSFTLIINDEAIITDSNSLDYQKYTDMNKTVFTIKVDK